MGMVRPCFLVAFLLVFFQGARMANAMELTDEMLDRVIKEVDTDENGQITLEELLEQDADTDNHEDVEKIMLEQFHAHDVGRKGHLTRDELRGYMQDVRAKADSKLKMTAEEL